MHETYVMRSKSSSSSQVASSRYRSIHNLMFESRPWFRDTRIQEFRIGTCHGLWQDSGFAYDIIAVHNDMPGNGHFKDVMGYFIHSAKRDGRLLRVMEVMNERLYKHLIISYGFSATVWSHNLINYFSDENGRSPSDSKKENNPSNEISDSTTQH